jgi:hypothetical protein
MRTVFADSHFYIAFLNPSDQHYQAAQAMAAEAGRGIVTTDFVLIEILDGLSAPPLRARAVAFVRALKKSRSTRVIAATPELFEKALELYERWLDKGWSFTDCASFVVMRDEGIMEALTGDFHFEQAGFRALLRSVP